MPLDQSKIHRLSLSENLADKLIAIEELRSNFDSLDNKSVAWDDLIRLASDDLHTLHRLTSDEDLEVIRLLADAIGSAFEHVPDKSAAWNDLHRLTSDENWNVRALAVDAIGSAFEHVPDKSAAWDDLHRLTSDEDWYVRVLGVYALSSALSSFTYKSAAWDDLHRLTSDENSEVRWNAALVLCSVFSSVSEMSVAWNDLIRLTNDEDSEVRSLVASSLGSIFPFVPEEYKPAVWNNLVRLSVNNDSEVRWYAGSFLGPAFSSLPEEYKSTAWNDLHRLIGHEDLDVRTSVIYTLSSAFSSIPEEYKFTAWNDLIGLASDKDCYVRMYANHSLGKICIYNASISDNEGDSRTLLEEAIQYFEKAEKETSWSNPAKFCSLFYRSFDAVLFKKVHSKKEIGSWITAAKKEIAGSDSKQKLIEAVEQLADVLEIAYNTRESNGDWRESLKRCSDICNHVDQLMDENKDKTPVIHGLYKKVKPSFDKTIENLIVQVKEKAEAACREAKGTPAEDAACAVSREVHKWKIGSQEYMGVQIQCTVSMLRSYVFDIEDNDSILNEINSILQEEDVVIQYMRFNSLVPKIINIRESRIIEFSEEMKALRKAVSKLSESIDELQNPQEYLDTIQRNLEEIKDEIPAMKKQIDDVLLELYSPMGIDQKLKVAIPIIPLLASYEIEINTPKFVVDRIDELKNLVLKFRE